jgi:RNA polymerase sigma-70 factor (ECF subfamily)
MFSYVSSVDADLRPSGRIQGVSLSRQPISDLRSHRLVAALNRREPEALNAIQDEYGAMLLGYLAGVLGDRATAEDVLQVTLLEIWERGAGYDPSRASLLTWMMMIARSRAIDHLRKRVPEPRDPLASADVFERERNPASETDLLLERWRIAQLLRRIPTEQAEILRLRFHDGLSQPEIAARIGVPLGTVKMRMVQALQRLREMIDSEEAGL